jgi:hypothetical protein
VPTFVGRGCRAVSTMDPHGCILSFLDQNRYNFFQVAPQLYSRGWVDPVPDPLLLRISGSAGNRTWDLWMCSQELWPLDHRDSAHISLSHARTHTHTFSKCVHWNVVHSLDWHSSVARVRVHTHKIHSHNRYHAASNELLVFISVQYSLMFNNTMWDMLGSGSQKNHHCFTILWIWRH